MGENTFKPKYLQIYSQRIVTMTTFIPSLTLPAALFDNPAASILFPIALGTAVGFSVRPKETQKTYMALKQPPYRPPPYVFGPAWTPCPPRPPTSSPSKVPPSTPSNWASISSGCPSSLSPSAPSKLSSTSSLSQAQSAT